MQKNFSNSGRGSSEEHFHKIILKSSHWLRRRCRLKFFSFLGLSGTILAILIEGHPRNIPVKLFQNPFIGLLGDVI